MQTNLCRWDALAALFLAAVSGQCAANLSPAGRWKAIDDKTGEARGIVRIYEEHGALFGKIEAAVKDGEAKEHCDLCRDDRKGKPIIGLLVLRGLRKQGEEYGGGDILDPDTGLVYRCKLRLLDEGKRLLVRGYLFAPLLGRSQIWIREE